MLPGPSLGFSLLLLSDSVCFQLGLPLAFSFTFFFVKLYGDLLQILKQLLLLFGLLQLPLPLRFFHKPLLGSRLPPGLFKPSLFRPGGFVNPGAGCGGVSRGRRGERLHVIWDVEPAGRRLPLPLLGDLKM